jgi:actin-related protein
MSSTEITSASGTSNTATTNTGGSLLLSQPIVIDNGTATIKAGFAGSSKPKVKT